MKATVSYIEKKFEEFNLLMFAGKLPKLPVELSDAKTFLGQCVFQTRRLPSGKVEQYNFRLRINTRIDLLEQDVEDTIIHEMIHYYIGINHLDDTSAHGPIFKQIMESINKKYGRHLSISHKGTSEQNEEAYDKRQHWHVVAVVEFKNGKTGIKVLPRVLPRILNYYNKFGADKMVSELKLFMSNDIFFNRFPNSGSLSATYIDRNVLMEHLLDAEEMQCDGKQVIRKGQNNSTEYRGQRTKRPQYHVIAVLTLNKGKTGVKVLPRVLPTILKYYNEIFKYSEVKNVELYMSNNTYFDKYPNSGSLIYHYEDETIVKEQLKNAEHLECDGKKVERQNK